MKQKDTAILVITNYYVVNMRGDRSFSHAGQRGVQLGESKCCSRGGLSAVRLTADCVQVLNRGGEAGEGLVAAREE